MPSRKSGLKAPPTLTASKPLRLLLFLLVAASLLLLQGCPRPPCPVCPDLQVTLPATQPPMLRRVDLLAAGTSGADYCLTDRGRRDVLINLEQLRSWGAENMSTIEQFNKREKKP